MRVIKQVYWLSFRWPERALAASDAAPGELGQCVILSIWTIKDGHG